MSAHTPGPWVNRGQVGMATWITDAPDGDGAAKHVAMVYGYASAEGRANATLITAAPDLLDAGTAALAAMREMHEAAQAGRQVFLDRGAHDALVAAIAKARGGK